MDASWRHDENSWRHSWGVHAVQDEFLMHDRPAARAWGSSIRRSRSTVFLTNTPPLSVGSLLERLTRIEVALRNAEEERNELQREVILQGKALADAGSIIESLRREIASLRVEPLTRIEAPAARFDALVTLWRQETSHSSSLSEKFEHPAYAAIIAMGHNALPFILRELERGRGHWHPALHQITGAQPVPNSARGRADSIAEAWLTWAKSKGLSW